MNRDPGPPPVADDPTCTFNVSQPYEDERPHGTRAVARWVDTQGATIAELCAGHDAYVSRLVGQGGSLSDLMPRRVELPPRDGEKTT